MQLHIYSLSDGTILPSVTSIISDAGLSDFSMVPPDVLERARNWGTALHRMVELWLKNQLDEDNLDEALIPSLNAARHWHLEHIAGNQAPGKCEVPNYHPKLRYAGIPDLVFPDLIVDIKTGHVNPLACEIQIVAYDMLDGGDREHRVLVLNQNGTYQYKRVNATKAKRALSWSRFRFLLDLYNKKREVFKWR